LKHFLNIECATKKGQRIKKLKEDCRIGLAENRLCCNRNSDEEA
jgi:hypothetical protein